MKFTCLLLLALALSAFAQVPAKTPQRDTAQGGGDTVQVKKSSVAFLGLESISENRFHETLEDRIYMMLSYNANVALESRDYYFRLKSRSMVSRKLLSMNEAVNLMRTTGDRIFVSGEIRNFRIELKRGLGFMPFGKVVGEIVCYLQVIDALDKEPRFAGNLKFTGETKTGWYGFSTFAGNMPLSPVEEKNFVFELINGMGEAFVETAEAAYLGIIDKKRPGAPEVRQPVRRGDNFQTVMPPSAPPPGPAPAVVKDTAKPVPPAAAKAPAPDTGKTGSAAPKPVK